jgi:hypothetical protein
MMIEYRYIPREGIPMNIHDERKRLAEQAVKTFSRKDRLRRLPGEGVLYRVGAERAATRRYVRNGANRQV